MRHRLLRAALLGLCVAPACRSHDSAREPAPPPAFAFQFVVPRPWQHESSDIPVDPRIHFGHLANGLRYAWMANSEPRERCYVRLHVDAGSLAEEEDERGMAHFLEHMAFNGTRDYPGTSVVEWFQRHGMGFGADSNASTSFSETIYELDLPRSDARTIAEGLHVLRQFADALTLDPAEVEDEKGVVDAEERERESAGWRAERERLERLLAGTRAAERIPIGDKAVRARFTAEGVRAFYEKWYRPDNMTLVLVGDVGALGKPALDALISGAFADLENPAAPRPREPVLGEPSFAELVFAVHAPELPTQTISARRLVRWEPEPATVARWTKDLPLAYARAMLDLRFAELAKKEDAAFLGAGAGDAELIRAVDGEELELACRPERWREALSACEAELRRAVEHGFRPAELSEVRANALRGLDEAVERESTRSSAAYAAALVSAAEDPLVPADARTRRAILKPAIEALTVEGCAAAFRAAWEAGAFSLTALGALDLGANANAELTQVWEEARAKPVEARGAIAAARFAYPAPPEPGPIAERAQRADLELEDVRFANGVRLLVKRTDFAERQVLFAVRLGEGELALGAQDEAAGWVLGQVFAACGLGAHSADDLRRLSAGKTVGGNFDVGSDAFAFSASTTAEDLVFQCELARAYIVDPGWREEGLTQFRRGVAQYYEGLAHQHAGPLLLDFLPALYGGDRRFAIPARAEVEAVTLDDLRRIFLPLLADAPITVTIVGDVAVDEAVAAVGRAFGTLPERRALRAHAERRQVVGPAPALQMERAVDTQDKKTLVLAVFPTTDGLDPRVRRQLTFLADVLGDRLRIAIREKLGASYSPDAGSESSTVFPGVGSLAVQAMADPEKARELVDACLVVAGELARAGATEEEVERLRPPILNRVRDGRRQNGFWIGRIADAHQRPGALEEIATLEEHYRGVRAEDLTPLAARYLVPERASVLLVKPQE